MHSEDTIAAISTPSGQGGIGIVRLSGTVSIEIAEKLFRSLKQKRLDTSPSHRMLYGHIIDPASNEIVDEVLLTVMKAPGTYTKEDMVEINCHGGMVPLRRTLELLLSSGARLAEPGEFTKRAFLNGRIDLAQAEAVLDVINALTVQSQKTALRQLSGGLSEKIGAIRQELIELTALVEACIDFPEDDIDALSLREMQERAHTIADSLTALIDSAHYGVILRAGLRTAIIGRPNVGKSSLLNALLEHDRAIVTEAPGTTRDVIEEYLSIRGIPVKIMDTAGIREVKDSAEKEGVRRSLKLMDDADLIMLLIDASEPLHETDRELLEKSSSKNTIVVLNKCDLPVRVTLKDCTPVQISAKRATGMETLRQAVVAAVSQGQPLQEGDVVTNIRHLHALEKTRASVGSFLSAAAQGTSPEFLALDLRDALDGLGEILGMTTPDEILNTIFSSFCIGK
jgi:tRNA modification GTPase